MRWCCTICLEKFEGHLFDFKEPQAQAFYAFCKNIFSEKSEIEPHDSLVNYPYITFISSPVAKMLLQTTDTLAFVKATYHVNSFAKCLITHSHYSFYHLTDVWGVGGNGGGATRKKDAKPVTAVQDCGSRRHFQPCLCQPRWAKTRLFPHPDQVFFCA